MTFRSYSFQIYHSSDFHHKNFLWNNFWQNDLYSDYTYCRHSCFYSVRQAYSVFSTRIIFAIFLHVSLLKHSIVELLEDFPPECDFRNLLLCLEIRAFWGGDSLDCLFSFNLLPVANIQTTWLLSYLKLKNCLVNLQPRKIRFIVIQYQIMCSLSSSWCIKFAIFSWLYYYFYNQYSHDVTASI